MSESKFITQIARIRKALRREFETRAAPLEVTASQLQVLRRLWSGDGINTSLLTQDACSDGGTVTGILDRLESKGLIRRERNAEDRRAVQIWLTTTGQALQQPLTEIIDTINKQALAGLSAGQQTQLAKALEKVGKNLNA